MRVDTGDLWLIYADGIYQHWDDLNWGIPYPDSPIIGWSTVQVDTQGPHDTSTDPVWLVYQEYGGILGLVSWREVPGLRNYLKQRQDGRLYAIIGWTFGGPEAAT